MARGIELPKTVCAAREDLGWFTRTRLGRALWDVLMVIASPLAAATLVVAATLALPVEWQRDPRSYYAWCVPAAIFGLLAPRMMFRRWLGALVSVAIAALLGVIIRHSGVPVEAVPEGFTLFEPVHDRGPGVVTALSGIVATAIGYLLGPMPTIYGHDLTDAAAQEHRPS